jgi:murein L,D-transpeptidase YcbB/YkuD
MLSEECLQKDTTVNPAGVLKGLVAQGTLCDLPQSGFPECAFLVRAFYESRGYAPAWTREGEPTVQAYSIIHVLESADVKGLSGTDYDAGEWANRVAELLKGRGHASEQDLARFDLRLTVSLTRYIAHVSVGKANPRIFSSAQEIENHRRELQ